MDIFVNIRSNPEGLCNKDLLKVFEKYLDVEMSIKELARLKVDIDEIKSVDKDYKEYLKNDMNAYIEDDRLSGLNKYRQYKYALKIITDEMIKLIESGNRERIHDFADAIHNFPVFLVNDLWKVEEYYEIYIKPYNKKWGDSFLMEMERKGKFKSLMSKFFCG